MNSRWQDTPAAVFMRLMADLMLVNLLTVLCSLPLVTMGASLSAMYAVLFKREQDEGTVAVTGTFFRAFKNNFLKATALGFVELLFVIVAVGDYWFALHSPAPYDSMYKIIGTVIAVLGLIFFLLAFAQQSIYHNTVLGYLKNSLMLTFCAPGQMILCLAVWILPWLWAFSDEEVLTSFGFFLLLWGLAFPAWLTAKLFWKVFQKTGQQNNDASPAT